MNHTHYLKYAFASVMLFSLFVWTIGCHRNPIQSKDNPLVYSAQVSVSSGTIDTIIAPRAGQPLIPTSVNVIVRDSIANRRYNGLLVSVTARMAIGTIREHAGYVNPDSGVSDTATSWGTNPHILLQLAPNDTGVGEVTARVTFISGSFITTTTKRFYVVPPQQ